MPTDGQERRNEAEGASTLEKVEMENVGSDFALDVEACKRRFSLFSPCNRLD